MMTLESADKIVKIWGKYIEFVHGKLTFIFGFHIPESFLPFPSETIEEASNVVAEQYHQAGQQDAVNAIEASKAMLLAYIDDEDAVLKAAKSINDPKWRAAWLPAFKKFSKNWIKTQGDFK